MALLLRPLRSLAAFTAILAAALALVLAAAAVPARADDNDLVRALAAVAVVGLIAGTLDNNGGDRRRNRRDDFRQDELPAYCAVDLRNRRADVVYAEPCLRNAGVEGRLPGYCARDVRVRGRNVTVYPQRCLLDAGYRIERRRR